MGATLAIGIVAALGADQLVVDATSDEARLAENDVRLAETIDTGGAVAALIGFATLVAVHADHRGICRWTGDTAVLIFCAYRVTTVRVGTTKLAGIVAHEWLACAVSAAACADIAIFVAATFFADAVAAEQTG